MNKLFCLWGILVLTSGLWAAGETLALTIDYDQGDVGEGHQVWSTRYYVDGTGRLARKVQVIEGETASDPQTTWETVYQWTPAGVEWNAPNSATHPLPIRFAGDGLERDDARLKGSVLRIRFLGDDQGSWTDGRWVVRWSAQGGFRKEPVESGGGGPGLAFGWTTSGSRLTQWFGGKENQVVILDRRPDQIAGTFVQPNANQTGWDVTGSLAVRGSGLWSDDPLILLTHLEILDEDGNLAWSAPLVWTRGYLR